MPDQGASFIPKSGVKTVQRTRSTRRIYLLAYVSYIVFFSTLFVVVGVYLYAATVNRSLDSLKEQLTTERQRFAVTQIEDVRQLDKRMRVAQRLLDESTAPSRIFSDIEAIVASNVQFSSMSYKQLANRQFMIDLVGRADNFNQVLSQRDLLQNSSILQDAVVTAYDYSVAGEEGASSLSGQASLSFTFSDTRDQSLIAYRPSETESTVVIQDDADTTVGTSTEEQASVNVGTSTGAVVTGEARAGSGDEPVEDEPQN